MGAGLLLVMAGSCRKESDHLYSYDHQDNLLFAAADTSFAAKFDLMWNAMNQNYAIWDYEDAMGVDWDAIYEECYPKFQELDSRGKDETVTDDEVKDLLGQCLGPLHDGHFNVRMKNHKTGTQVYYNPAAIRNQSRDDYAITGAFSPNLPVGEAETDAAGNPIVKSVTTTPLDALLSLCYNPGIGVSWAKEMVNELQAMQSLTEQQSFILQGLNGFISDVYAIFDMSLSEAVGYINNLWVKYSYLDIPGFEYIDPGYTSAGLRTSFSLLKGNIAYYYTSNFQLYYYLEESLSDEKFDMSYPKNQDLVQRVREVWQAWFDTVQQLHSSGNLGGVIIDLRGNIGGNVAEFMYVVGSLLPSGTHVIGYHRQKRGTGRYEYSQLIPLNLDAISAPHEAITEPVVVLVDGRTASTGEISALGVRSMPNGTVIGKRTWGGLCILLPNEFYSVNYSGKFGVQGITSVSGYVPTYAVFSLDKELLEGQGISPDIEVDLDLELYQSTGKDTQLARAMQFIRTGK